MKSAFTPIILMMKRFLTDLKANNRSLYLVESLTKILFNIIHIDCYYLCITFFKLMGEIAQIISLVKTIVFNIF